MTLDMMKAVLLLIRLGHAGSAKSVADLVVDLLAGRLKITDLVRSFQTFHGLTPTGELKEIGPKIALPRCACPDVMAASTTPCKWPGPNVTYHQSIALPTIAPEKVAALYQAAWNQWSGVCGLNPLLVGPDPRFRANVSARSGEGAADQFDAGGSILAWSQLPLGADANTELLQVFNDLEPWTEAMFLAVACHEIGHAIGLSHSPGACLMNPYYDPTITAPTPADASAAQALYGPPRPKSLPLAPAPANPPAPVPSSVSPASFILDFPVAGKYLVTISQQ